MKRFLFFITFLVSLFKGYSQQMPPVTLGGANICDPSPWQLIFSDDFNGDTLDLTKWHTYGVYFDQFPPGDNWGNARCGQGSGAVYLDDNVVVSDGTCKLITKEGFYEWNCDTCAIHGPFYTRDATSGEIETYFDTTHYFNSGRFEARMKMPDFDYAHSTFWTWPGGDTRSGVDEVDIAESKGGPANNRGCTNNVHAWAPTDAGANPYGVPTANVLYTFPNQNWYNYIIGNFFDQTQWHTYTCEWDTDVVRFYLDGTQTNSVWKYYQDASYYHFFSWHHYNKASTCNPASGTYKVQLGFPYNNDSKSHLIISGGADDITSLAPLTLGQVEIDYVRMWQRHPEASGYPAIATPFVSGPDIICNGGTATYTVSPPANEINPDYNGVWSAYAATNLSSNNDEGVYEFSPGGSFIPFYDVIIYTYGDASLPPPPLFATKNIDLGVQPSSNWNVVCANVHTLPNHQHFQLTVSPNVAPVSNTTYTWTISYGATPTGTLYSYTNQGQTISTPIMNGATFDPAYITWSLAITNACGTTTITGSKTFPGKFHLTDVNDNNPRLATNHYVKAELDETSVKNYNSSVSVAEDHLFIDEKDAADTVFINTAIENIMMDALAPYITYDTDTVVTPKGVLAVTEFTKGATANCDYVEMVVANCGTDTSSNVDIRGWVIDDNSGNFDASGCANNEGITTGHYRLAYDNLWEKVPVGSVIVMYNHDANCYNLPDSFTVDTSRTGIQYWIPIGGSAASPYENPHVDMYTINPGVGDCTYCGDSSITTYTTAAAWSTVISLASPADAIQVRCPGCTVASPHEPAFYQGAAYYPASGNFENISGGTNNLPSYALSYSSSLSGYQVIFNGDLSGPSGWALHSAPTAHIVPSSLGVENSSFMSLVASHSLDLPCCGTHGGGERKAPVTQQNNIPTDIRVYPNPANTIVYFEFPKTATTTVKVYSITGMLLDNQTVYNTTNTSMSTSKYAPGIYLYQIITDSNVHSGKLFIEK